MRSTGLLAAGFAVAVHAQVPAWGQCGGLGYSGSTSCAGGSVCTPQNAYYHQCVPGAETAKPTTTLKTSTIVSRTATSSATPSSTGGTAGTRYFISFGDSYSQTGFNINSTKPSAANPLGNPGLPGWTASGGLDWVGFMVTEFNKSLLLSYNFAYGGATTDADLVTPYQNTVLSFEDQVTEFSRSLAPKPSYAPWTAANTLVGVWMGVNDVGNTFYLANRQTLIPQVVSRYFALLQTVYDGGARNFVLLTIPPTEKTPLMLANGPDSNALLAATIKQYNDLVVSNLASFKAKNSGVTAWIVDTAAPFNEALNNPTKYGSPDATCFNSNGLSCLWFDNYHPGVRVQELVAAAVAKTVGAPWFTA